MVESVSMATTSLISLVQLLDKVKNMVISDHIQQEVRNVSSFPGLLPDFISTERVRALAMRLSER